MKKSVLILLTFIPIIVGYIVNFTISIPVIGMMIFYALPLLTTLFWICFNENSAKWEKYWYNGNRYAEVTG